jgi:protein-L-isoaspartate(D-aspartate) O-methyltransferase
MVPGLAAGPGAKLSAVTTDTTQASAAGPEQLRAALADEIRGYGVIRTPQVDAAFRAVPRHLFLPGTDLATAYAARVVVTKRAADGAALSSASHPSIVAAMLEQLDVQAGQQVLEIGAGTGINAALLAELTGPAGQVTTIDIDDDIVAGARHGLSAAGYHRAQVICGDGADGYPPGAPYDRIIVTAGAWDLALAWWQQLAAGGRLVVPLLLHGSGLTRSIAFDHQPGRMVSSSAQVCGFVAMRGAGARAGHTVQLADDVALQLDTTSPSRDTALSQALTWPGQEHWTGVLIGDGQPAEHLDLWLATTSSGFSRLHAGPRARESGLVTPALRWGGAAVHDDENLAYLTLRPHDTGTAELGVICHGPASRDLAARTAGYLRTWNRERPDQPVITAQPARTPDDQLPAGHHIEKPGTRLTISW